MKLNYIFVAAAVLAFGACSGHSGSTTLLRGIVPTDYEGQIHVKSGDIDTLINAEEGSFKIDLPVVLTSASSVQTDEGAVGFISDGTKITVNFTDDEPIAVSSGKGACAAYSAYQEQTKNFFKSYGTDIEKIQSDPAIPDDQKDSLIEASYNSALEKFFASSKEVIAANSDNYTAVVALGNIYSSLDTQTLLGIISSLSPELQEDDFVSALSKSIMAQTNTAEGKPFTDFEVETTPGHFEKLSDYVGKGKYMLVDFWASWCGPCKKEIPNLKEVYAKHHGDNFDILSVAVWDKPQASLDTAAAYKIPWNQMINTQNVATDIYGIQGIPHIILFGPDGTILKRDLRGEDIEKTVSEYVK